MNKGMYRKLALKNIKSNQNTYLPFGICAVTMVALFYMMSVISYSVDNSEFTGQSFVSSILHFGEIICGGFGFFIIMYTNSFLVKRRSKELGLYSILGMEKKHISRVLFWEIFFVAITSILLGLIIGMSFSRLILLLMENIIKAGVTLQFGIWLLPIVITVLLFIIVFAVSILGNTLRVFKLRPMELMRSSKVGEKEPKANWVLAVLGVICLAAGYYISITTENPVSAVVMFFVAVVLVIVGTYFIFVSGMVALLKILKKNPHYYYKKNHFITVSGLIYRMKHNAVGLANICVLSTAVLVVMFTTISLYAGTEDTLSSRFKKDVRFVAYKLIDETDTGYEKYDASKVSAKLHEIAEEHGVSVSNESWCFVASETCTFDGSEYTYTSDYLSDNIMVNVLTLDKYNEATGQNLSLAENEVLYYSTAVENPENNIFAINGVCFNIVGEFEENSVAFDESNISGGYTTVVVKDQPQMDRIIKGHVTFEYLFDVDGDEEAVLEFCEDVNKTFNAKEIVPHFLYADNIFKTRQDIYGLYGSLFFIGVFVGLMFMTTTAMIIYYKQISEGTEDREKFQIMRKVGMSDKEIKATIRSQVLTIFMLPIVFATIHVLVAFTEIRRILQLMIVADMSLLASCFGATVLIYLLIYVAIYRVTAKSYYRCLMQ